MVITRCSTYNHAQYIVDAMNGFCMQETSFPVIYVIIDDASTDGEQDVIKQYLQDNFDLNDTAVTRLEETDDYKLIYAQHNINKNCYFAVLFLKYNHYSIKKDNRPYYADLEKKAKYIAFCEGDDFWTHPKKLQMQVDFLESHPEYTAIAENGWVKNSIKGKEYPVSTRTSHDVSIEEVITTDPFQTAGYMCRTDALSGFYEACKYTHDRMLWSWCASKGKIYFSEIISSVYRKGKQGVTESTRVYTFTRDREDRFLEMQRVFNIPKNIIYRLIIKKYIFSGIGALRRGQIKDAFKCELRGFICLFKWIFK